MLEIKNLHASVEGKEILKGINLTINDGEVHVLMGPNGSGKSTLSNVLVGNPKYDVTEGTITFNGKDLLALPPEDRSHEGIFMSFQAPTEIPGVSMTNFMRAAINAKRKYFGQEPIPAGEFLKLLKEKRKLVGLDAHFMSRGVNEGFSGGERKRNEISRWLCSNRLSVFLTKQTPALTLMLCASWQKASICCARLRRVLWSSPTISVCSTI